MHFHYLWHIRVSKLKLFSVVGWGTILQAGRSPVQVPDEVDFFNWPNLYSRTMALGLTQPLYIYIIVYCNCNRLLRYRIRLAISPFNIWAWNKDLTTVLYFSTQVCSYCITYRHGQGLLSHSWTVVCECVCVSAFIGVLGSHWFGHIHVMKD
jgi:hypothetical protein